MPFASCHEAAAARCCAQLLGSSSRGCRCRRIRSMGMEAAIAAFTTAFGLAALRSCFADCADHAACSPSCVGAAAPVSEGAAIARDASAALIAAAWRASRQSHAARAAARLAAALSEASHSARSAPLAQMTGAYAPPPHRAQPLPRFSFDPGVRLLPDGEHRPAVHCSGLFAGLRCSRLRCTALLLRPGLGPAQWSSRAPLPSRPWGQQVWGPRHSYSRRYRLALALTGSAVHPGAMTEALAASEELRRSADDGPYVPFDEPAWLQQAEAAEARQRDRRTLRSVAFGLQTSHTA